MSWMLTTLSGWYLSCYLKVTKSHINKSSACILDNALIYIYYQVHFCELPVETFPSVTSEDWKWILVIQVVWRQRAPGNNKIIRIAGLSTRATRAIYQNHNFYGETLSSTPGFCQLSIICLQKDINTSHVVANPNKRLCSEIRGVVIFYNRGSSRNCELLLYLSELLNFIFQYQMLSTKPVT